jgi:hypothetical protein
MINPMPVICECVPAKKFVAPTVKPPIPGDLGKGLPGIEHSPKMIGRLRQDRNAVTVQRRKEWQARREAEAVERMATRPAQNVITRDASGIHTNVAQTQPLRVSTPKKP